MAAKATPPGPKKGDKAEKRGPGAGRPKAELTKTRDEIDAMIAAKIVKDLPRIYKALIDLALGHELQERTKDGGTVVYTISPDFKAASYLIDRAAGKPRQPVDVKAEVNPADDKVDERVAAAGIAAAIAAEESIQAEE